MINWVLVIYLHTTPDIWGYYGSLEKCQRTISDMSKYYERKGKEFKAECLNVNAVQVQGKQ